MFSWVVEVAFRPFRVKTSTLLLQRAARREPSRDQTTDLTRLAAACATTLFFCMSKRYKLSSDRSSTSPAGAQKSVSASWTGGRVASLLPAVFFTTMFRWESSPAYLFRAKKAPVRSSSVEVAAFFPKAYSSTVPPSSAYENPTIFSSAQIERTCGGHVCLRLRVSSVTSVFVAKSYDRSCRSPAFPDRTQYRVSSRSCMAGRSRSSLNTIIPPSCPAAIRFRSGCTARAQNRLFSFLEARTNIDVFVSQTRIDLSSEFETT
eukprot:gene3665-biopygen3608